VFDESLERAWKEALPDAGNPLADPYLDLWHADGAAPAVLANTTQVENGMRVVVAPFMSIDGPLQAGTLHQRTRFQRYVEGVLIDEGWEALASTEDIRLSTALGLSARFPWIMPAARFVTSKTEFRLVDGGYIDNSGDETAFDLLMELRQIQAIGGSLTTGQLPPFEIHLITLTAEGALAPGAVEGFGELLSPIRTLLSSRPTRADIATHRVRALLNPGSGLTAGTVGAFTSPSPIVKLNRSLPLPLTWQLSSATHRLIGAQLGDAASCRQQVTLDVPTLEAGTPVDEEVALVSIGQLVQENSCVACSIAYRLTGRTAPMGAACDPL
jgi:hypothetical protein